jgi:hypothetical protein
LLVGMFVHVFCTDDRQCRPHAAHLGKLEI